MLRFCDQRDELGTGWFPTKEDVAIIYDGTPDGSPARSLMVYLPVEHGSECWISGDAERNHPQFLSELCRALLRRVADLDADDKPEPELYGMRDRWMKKGKE